MRRSDRSDFKNTSFTRSNNHRDSRNDRYHDDKYRTSNNKSFDFKRPRSRRDYESHSYQDRRDSSRDHHRYETQKSFHRKDERSSFRNHSSPQSRSRDRDFRGGGGGGASSSSSSSFRSNDIRRRLSSPQRMRPATTGGIKSRLAPRITSRRIAPVSSSSRILHRSDLRGGVISKRSAAPVNRAKEYAKKIKQARMKLNENSGGGGASSSTRVKSTTSEGDAKSPKGGMDENNEEDFLAIANDVNFDDDDRESTSGNKVSKKVNKDEDKGDADDAGDEGGGDGGNEEEKKKKKSVSEELSTSKDGKSMRHAKSKSKTRSVSMERVRKPFDRIEYVCIHCNKRSNSAQEYRSHLSGRKHLLAMRNVGLRVRATLNRLRKVQRDKQLEIEAMIKDVEDIPSKYCQTCKLNYRQTKEEHHESEDHKKIRNFLKPYCKICRMQLISPMKYEVHRCHTDHIRRKLKAQEASDDEINLENMDMSDFKTVDSVGNVDDDSEMNEDTAETVVGREHVTKIEVHYCSLCHDFVCRDGDDAEEELIADHCKSRHHFHRFNDHNEEEERKEARMLVNKKRDGMSPEKATATKQNGNDTKHEKNDTNDVDRDADVNLDENTYEGSENAEDN